MGGIKNFQRLFQRLVEKRIQRLIICGLWTAATLSEISVLAGIPVNDQTANAYPVINPIIPVNAVIQSPRLVTKARYQIMTTGAEELTRWWVEGLNSAPLHQKRLEKDITGRFELQVLQDQQPVYATFPKLTELQAYLGSDSLLNFSAAELRRRYPLLDNPSTSGSRSISELVSAVSRSAQQEVTLDPREWQFRGVSDILRDGRGSTLDRAILAVSLLRSANIPSRLVFGLVFQTNGLSGQGGLMLHPWVEYAAALSQDFSGSKNIIWLGVDPNDTNTTLDATHIRLFSCDAETASDCGQKISQWKETFSSTEIKVLEVSGRQSSTISLAGREEENAKQIPVLSIEPGNSNQMTVQKTGIEANSRQDDPVFSLDPSEQNPGVLVPEKRFYKGVEKFYQGNIDEARQIFESCSVDDPSPVARLNLAIQLQALGWDTLATKILASFIREESTLQSPYKRRLSAVVTKLWDTPTLSRSEETEIVTQLALTGTDASPITLEKSTAFWQEKSLKFPNWHIPWVYLGNNALQSGRLDSAEVSYLKAYELNQSDVRALYGLADIYQRQKNQAKLSQLLEKIRGNELLTSLEPSAIESLESQLQIQRSMGQRTPEQTALIVRKLIDRGLISEARQLLQTVNTKTEALLLLRFELNILGAYWDAAREDRRALEKSQGASPSANPSVSTGKLLWLCLNGILHTRNREYAQAHHWFYAGEKLSQNPNLLKQPGARQLVEKLLLAHLSLFERENNTKEQSRILFQTVSQYLNPLPASWLLRQADFLLRHGSGDSLAAADKRYEEALSRLPNSSQGYAGWALLAYRQDKLSLVKDRVMTALTINPHESSALLTLANLYRSQGNTTEAWDVLQTLSLSDPAIITSDKTLTQWIQALHLPGFRPLTVVAAISEDEKDYLRQFIRAYQKWQADRLTYYQALEETMAHYDEGSIQAARDRQSMAGVIERHFDRAKQQYDVWRQLRAPKRFQEWQFFLEGAMFTHLAETNAFLRGLPITENSETLSVLNALFKISLAQLEVVTTQIDLTLKGLQDRLGVPVAGQIYLESSYNPSIPGQVSAAFKRVQSKISPILDKNSKQNTQGNGSSPSNVVPY
ncbi:MAG: hypothetical protein K2X01_00895 [Cyanobacteria bacterium]|nr:hypothetical protein [Cyanobacteriota bacterium]